MLSFFFLLTFPTKTLPYVCLGTLCLEVVTGHNRSYSPLFCRSRKSVSVSCKDGPLSANSIFTPIPLTQKQYGLSTACKNRAIRSSRGREVSKAIPLPFSCPVQRQPCSERRSLADNGAARRDRRPACPMPDRGLGWPGPFAALVLFARSSEEKVTAHPPPGSPDYARGRRCLSAERRISPFINRDIFSSFPSGENEKNKKFFSCAQGHA